MESIRFQGIGTQWHIRIDEKVESVAALTAQLHGLVADFEQHFSRFLTTSEVNAFRNAAAGVTRVSDDLAIMLAAAARLREVTDGAFDPAIARVLENAGYDAAYRLVPREDVAETLVGEWALDGNLLTISGPVAFDIGGIGKGYCIDHVAAELMTLGYAYFLVEAGGDMFGTTKADGAPWEIALEWPGRPERAIATCKLAHQGLAASDGFRRKWGAWHHIVHARKKLPVAEVIGAAAVAHSAFAADQLTSAAFLGGYDAGSITARELDASFYLVNALQQIRATDKHPFVFLTEEAQ